MGERLPGLRATAASVLALAVAVAAVGCSGDSDSGIDARTVSDGEYASTVCSTLDDLRQREVALASDHSDLESEDPAVFQRDAVGLVERYADQVRSARADLEEVRPETGAAAAGAFDAYLGTAVERLDTIVSELRDADATAAEFQADVSTFEANLQFLSHELDDPFAGLDDPELLAAFRDEPACTELVQVSGG